MIADFDIGAWRYSSILLELKVDNSVYPREGEESPLSVRDRRGDAAVHQMASGQEEAQIGAHLTPTELEKLLFIKTYVLSLWLIFIST